MSIEQELHRRIMLCRDANAMSRMLDNFQEFVAAGDFMRAKQVLDAVGLSVLRLKTALQKSAT